MYCPFAVDLDEALLNDTQRYIVNEDDVNHEKDNNNVDDNMVTITIKSPYVTNKMVMMTTIIVMTMMITTKMIMIMIEFTMMMTMKIMMTTMMMIMKSMMTKTSLAHKHPALCRSLVSKIQRLNMRGVQGRIKSGEIRMMMTRTLIISMMMITFL